MTRLGSEKWLIITLVGAWNRTLYEIWWRPRTCRIQKEHRRIVKRLEKLRKKEERERKAQSRKTHMLNALGKLVYFGIFEI